MKALSKISLFFCFAGWSCLLLGKPSIPDDGSLYFIEWCIFIVALICALISWKQRLSKISICLMLMAAAVANPITNANDREIMEHRRKANEKIKESLKKAQKSNPANQPLTTPTLLPN